MKKYGLILTIVIAILLAHVVILYSCIHFSKNDSQATEKPSEEQIAEETADAPAVSDFKSPGASKPVSGVPLLTIRKVEPQPGAASSTRYDLPFTYAHAVNGNIPALPSSRNAGSGILVDLMTRNVLWQKQAQSGFPIASMTKIMTILLVYEDILAGRNGITLDTPVKVSVAAMKIGGSQVYLDAKETFPVRDLLKATAIQSANDAAYLLAEHVGNGDVSAFVERMNRRAAEIGMVNTRFFNPHGLPGPTASQDNAASPEGMAKLAEITLMHPQLVEWTSTRLAPFRTPGTKGFIQMKNHNHLIPGSAEHAPGVNGLKTGFTNRSRFCVTVTCNRNNRVMVAVVTGFADRRERDRFVRSLLDWGYARAADPAAALKRDAYAPVKKESGARKNTVSKRKIKRRTQNQE